MKRRAFLKTAIAAAVSGNVVDEIAVHIPLTIKKVPLRSFSFTITQDMLKDPDDAWFYCTGGMCRCGHYHEPGWFRPPVYDWVQAAAQQLANQVDREILRELTA